MAEAVGAMATEHSGPEEAATTSPPPDGSALVAVDGERKKLKKIVKKKRRPARPQVDPATFKSEPPPQTGTVFNIWYNKWSGGDSETGAHTATPAKGRCNVALDTGYTRADRTPGSYFCLFFARGLCPKGKDCQYLHRLPNSRNDKDGGLGDIFPSNVDCFGRDKFSDYRDDMGGVGSFMRINRTIYIGRIHVSDDIEEVVARHFQEWGQVERIRVLPARGVAFVTYIHLANAEFAKEAMAHQSLDHTETLNVRWATMDPNPGAQKREARKIEEQAAEAIRRALPAEYVAELEGRGAGWEEATKRRKIEGSFGLEGYSAPDKVWYAAEQARNDASRQQSLKAPGDDDDDGGESLTLDDIQKARARQTSGREGIIGTSTVQALRGFTATSGSVRDTGTRPASALVVGYDSDDD